MGRPYNKSEYASIVNSFKDRYPLMSLGADVMVGFPGETRDDFQESYDLIRELPLNYLHIFPFSPRPGTRAFSMPDQVPIAEKKERVKSLKAMDRVKRSLFLWQNIARPTLALVENTPDPISGRQRVLTGNYIQALLPEGSEEKAGELVMVELLAIDNPSRSEARVCL
jgi:threonylcarbamoyladenosine tRNA methylthiotransferase MtaB